MDIGATLKKRLLNFFSHQSLTGTAEEEKVYSVRANVLFANAFAACFGARRDIKAENWKWLKRHSSLSLHDIT